MNETTIQNAIRIALSNAGVRVFRNNVGMLIDQKGNRVRYGLCNGSSDLIGWTPVTITPGMVGKPAAIFTAVEVKRPGGRPTTEQRQFIEVVRQAGGIAYVATSPDEALSLLRRLSPARI